MKRIAVKPTIFVLLALCTYAQQSSPVEHGRALYRSNCAFCHSLDGKGGRGPNLVSAPLNHGDSDEAIAKVVRSGVPGSTMPAFSGMDADEMKHLILYLRQLSGGAPRTPVKVGDAAAGQTVYAKAGCANCHRINGQGSVYGPDLSRVGAARSVEYLRESLVNPSADILPEYEGVTVVTKAGAKVTGVRINEDSFSVQLREPSQRFRSFLRNEAKEVIEEKKSLMPAYTRLSPADLNNLLEYLLSLRGSAAGQVKQLEGIK